MQSVVENLARGRLEEVEREGERVDEGLRGEAAGLSQAKGKEKEKEGGKRYVGCSFSFVCSLYCLAMDDARRLGWEKTHEGIEGDDAC